MVRTSFWSRKARRKNCGKETLPGASSLHKCSTKQRCISKTMWESRSASARIWSLGLRANAVTVSVFKAIKLETRAKPVKPGGESISWQPVSHFMNVILSVARISDHFWINPLQRNSQRCFAPAHHDSAIYDI